MEELAFCPGCYRQIPLRLETCPHCGVSLSGFEAKSYSDRLISALGHPLADVRMRAIIALGLRGEIAAQGALVECALRHPVDVVEGLEIVSSLRRIREAGAGDEALQTLAVRHPAQAVRSAAAEILRSSPRGKENAAPRAEGAKLQPSSSG
jgi:HEAT repeat protein